jgi:hypothetical protein
VASPCTTCVVATCLPHSASRASDISPRDALALAATTARASKLSGSAPLPPIGEERGEERVRRIGEERVEEDRGGERGGESEEDRGGERGGERGKR